MLSILDRRVVPHSGHLCNLSDQSFSNTCGLPHGRYAVETGGVCSTACLVNADISAPQPEHRIQEIQTAKLPNNLSVDCVVICLTRLLS
jgi:hypothetical protein